MVFDLYFNNDRSGGVEATGKWGFPGSSKWIMLAWRYLTDISTFKGECYHRRGVISFGAEMYRLYRFAASQGALVLYLHASQAWDGGVLVDFLPWEMVKFDYPIYRDPETNSEWTPLKMDAWKTIGFLLGWLPGRCELLVSRSVMFSRVAQSPT